MSSTVEAMIRQAGSRARSGFRPELDETQGPYRLRFARSDRDLDAICRLRFDVFNVELCEGLDESEAARRDLDPYDVQCDHLLVEKAASGCVIGTYRLQVKEMADAGRGFYSADEFDLDCFPAHVLADAVELGRACISREHRNTRVLYLLWRGLAAYVLWNGRRYFLGCSSLTTQDHGVGLQALDQLREGGHLSLDFHVRPRAGFECDPTAERPARVKFPTLFRTYLRHGACACGPPAIDRRFKTIDFLTLLDVFQLPPKTWASFSHGLEALDGSHSA